MKEIRCPFCHVRIGDCTPLGRFNADIKCRGCNLRFVIEFPDSVMVYQGSVLDLLMKRWGLVCGEAWRHLEQMPVTLVAGVPLIRWDTVIAVAPPAGRKWEAPYNERRMT